MALQRKFAWPAAQAEPELVESAWPEPPSGTPAARFVDVCGGTEAFALGGTTTENVTTVLYEGHAHLSANGSGAFAPRSTKLRTAGPIAAAIQMTLCNVWPAVQTTREP